jgi:cyanophycin synthetase
VQLGHGAAQRRIWTAETDRTSAIAEGISRDKDLTKRCWPPAACRCPKARWSSRRRGLGSGPGHRPAGGRQALGRQPRRGVSLDLSTQGDMATAFAAAEAEGSEVIVERFIPGDEHRLLVVGGKVVAAMRGEIIHVTGDGRSTIGALIDLQINTDPRRGAEHLPLEALRHDDPVLQLLLQRQGWPSTACRRWASRPSCSATATWPST